MMKSISVEQELMLINGEGKESINLAVYPVETPAKRGTVIAEVPRASAEDVDIAVKAAHEAFKSWREVPSHERGRLLYKIADAVEEQIDDIARTIAAETGNAIGTQSREEVKIAVEVFRYFAGIASELKGSMLPIDDNLMAYTQREPYGVVGAIVPWNTPFLLSTNKIAPAIITGNTIVLKAAKEAP